MKQRTLLLVAAIASFSVAAQKKQQKVTGYAITGIEKGNHSWKEVRLVDVASGTELQSIYSSKSDIIALNARTGKPVEKKSSSSIVNAPRIVNGKKVVSLDAELIEQRASVIPANTVDNAVRVEKELQRISATAPRESYTKDGKTIVVYQYSASVMSTDKPFATTSAAMAYDKKHDRLYYTPMNINQLRYIDMKSKSPAVYFFEGEAFGSMSPGVDGGKQITRMAFGSDGNGYALTNDANSLIRFTTGKNPEITDLGPLVDDAANGKFSVHSRGGYGGDLIADKSGNLYLITANRNVYKFSIEGKVAKHLGTIKGLPQGFQTNGAMVEEGSKVIVCSSESTVGYFRFDLNTLEAEKASEGADVFNASDLANGNLAFAKKEKEKKEKPENVVEEKKSTPIDEALASKKDALTPSAANGIAVYPNPVTDNLVKLSFTDQPSGTYQVQFLDLSGRVISQQQVIINSKFQIAEFRIPQLVSAGTYYMKIFNEANKVSSLTKLVVQ